MRNRLRAATERLRRRRGVVVLPLLLPLLFAAYVAGQGRGRGSVTPPPPAAQVAPPAGGTVGHAAPPVAQAGQVEQALPRRGQGGGRTETPTTPTTPPAKKEPKCVRAGVEAITWLPGEKLIDGGAPGAGTTGADWEYISIAASDTRRFSGDPNAASTAEVSIQPKASGTVARVALTQDSGAGIDAVGVRVDVWQNGMLDLDNVAVPWGAFALRLEAGPARSGPWARIDEQVVVKNETWLRGLLPPALRGRREIWIRLVPTGAAWKDNALSIARLGQAPLAMPGLRRQPGVAFCDEGAR